MGIFKFMKSADINQGIEEWKNMKGSILIDVRTSEEYREGHIPGSINIPLNEIDTVTEKGFGKELPIFVHCRSGSRSSQAEKRLLQLGYTKVKNIGGFMGYKGKVEV